MASHVDIRAYLGTRRSAEPTPGIGWALRDGRSMRVDLQPWSPAEQRFIRLLTRRLHARWGECYATAQRATLLAAEMGTGPHRLDYCEGYASLPAIPAPFAHAWCLLNGRVWDPTPRFSGLRAAYFGREIPLVVLRRAVAGRRAWGPIIL